MAFQSVYRKPIYKGYLEKKFLIEDTSRSSENYFVVTNFPTAVGGGKYVFSLQGNPNTLRVASEIDVEILDIEGNPIYSEVTNFRDRFNNYYISFEIYDITAPGVATATVVGLASFDAAGNRVTTDLRERFNVKWVGRFNILPAERNNAELLFDDPPEVGVAQITIPTRVSISVTQSAYNFSILTSSVSDNLRLLQPSTQAIPSSQPTTKTLDPRLQSIIINTSQGSSTTNTVPPAVRSLISSTNGSVINYNDQYSVVVRSDTPLFSKELEGGIFSFYSSESLSGNSIAQLSSCATRSLQSILTSSLSNISTFTPDVVFAGSNITYVQSSSILTPTIINTSTLASYQKGALYESVGKELKVARLAFDQDGLYKQLIKYAAYIVEVPDKFTLRLSEPLRLVYYRSQDSFDVGASLQRGPTYLLDDEYELFNNTKLALIASGGQQAYIAGVDPRKDLPISQYYGNQLSYADLSVRHNYFPLVNFRGFTGSIAYLPPPISFVTSSVVSSSYLEVTFGNLNPISGQVYRIKTSAKLGSIVGDYKLINDQIVQPVEYLTDAAFPNQTTRGRKYTDYRLIGYFESQSLLDTYWTFFQEHPNIVGVITGSIWSSGSYARIPTAYTQSGIFTTQFNQNYPAKKAFTLSFKALLDPNIEMEVYMNSDPINLYTQVPQTYLRGFVKDKNIERNRYSGGSSRFGKFIGKIPNYTVSIQPPSSLEGQQGPPAPQEYQFDFETDENGLGRPLFRARVKGESASSSGSVYITDVSIKALVLNGFTPNILQYSVPLPAELVEASALSQSINFKLDYFDYTGKQSEYTTYLDDVVLNYQVDVPSNTCQDHKIYFYATTAFGSSSINTPPTNS